MGRSLQKLADVYVKSTKLKPGRHSDGGGLYLNVAPGGSKSWVFVWTREKRKREMGLGAYPTVTLTKARARAADCRTAVEDGRDPIAERDKEEEPTFGACVALFLETMEGGWRNAKHRAQWRSTLDNYCVAMTDKRVSTIGTDDVLSALAPIWASKAETASRLRGRIERVLDFARAKGWRTGENPALWRGHLRHVLPARQKLQREPHAAMGYADVPAFVARLQGAEAMAARALEFLILTAGRSGEVLEATWSEIDLEAAVWTVPAARMKAGKVHRVPLCERAVAIVRALQETRVSDYVFPGERRARPLSNMALAMLMRRMKADAFTPHGFRSSFRDWAGDCTSFAREVAEAALAHEVGNAVELAYRRSDALMKRRELMDAWSRFVLPSNHSNVVTITKAKRLETVAATTG